MGRKQSVLALSIGVLLAAGTLNSAAPLDMKVTPVIARAPALLTVRVMVNATSDDRMLHVSAVSANFYRSSEIPLDGKQTPAVNVFEFRNLPPGLYEITGVLVTAQGPRATVSRLAKVEGGAGSN
jgi:hypothetical protein